MASMQLHKVRTAAGLKASRAVKLQSSFDSAMDWTVGVVMLTHPSVTRILVQTFDCHDAEDGSSYLAADYRAQCTAEDGSIDPVHALHTTVAVVSLAVWCGLLPAVVMLRLHRSRTTIVRGAYLPGLAPLYSRYRTSCYYWGVYEALYRSVLCGWVILLYRGSVAQSVLCCGLAGLALSAVLWSKPLRTNYVSALANKPTADNFHNLLLACSVGGSVAAYALCAFMHSVGSDSTKADWTQTAQTWLALIQLPALLAAALLVCAPVRRECRRSFAAERAFRHSNAIVVERPITPPKPQTPESQQSDQQSVSYKAEPVWPEKDEDRGVSRSRRWIEDAMSSLEGQAARKARAEKYIAPGNA